MLPKHIQKCAYWWRVVVVIGKVANGTIDCGLEVAL